MSAWERWAKRILKGILWGVFLTAASLALDVKLTWQTLVLIVSAGFVDSVLDTFWPTVSRPSLSTPEKS